MTIIRRNRAKQALALKVRLIKAARASRDAANAACTETERLELLKRARRYEVTAGFDEWLSSPGSGRQSEGAALLVAVWIGLS